MLGPTKFAETTSLFSVEDLRQEFGRKMNSRSLHTVLQRLLSQGRIRRLARGLYSGLLARVEVDRYNVPRKLRPDAVVAFHSALEYHGLANQTFQTVYYLSVKPRAAVVVANVRFQRVAPPARLLKLGKVDFETKQESSRVVVTRRERSVVDCLASLDYSGGLDELDRCLGMFPSFNFATALEYLNLLRRPWLYARLGYVLDRHAGRLGFRGEWKEALLNRLPRGVVYLGPKRKGCRWVREWNLMVPPSLPPLQPERTEQ